MGVPADADAGTAGLYLGLISGTSADGIDAALVEFDAAGACRLLAGHTYLWDPALRARLVALGQGAGVDSPDEIGTLDAQVGEAFAAAARGLVESAGVRARDVRAIGSHGQTIRHRPHGASNDGRNAFTWQIGDAHRIAERTGILTVADFRRRDVAAGGHGAPLVPAFHAALLRAAGEDRAVLNLGGIANFTLLPAEGDVRGFDTGPANALMDAWCLLHTGHAFDADGTYAAGGRVDKRLLQRLLDDPWFAQPPPKSTGREQFHLDWVSARLQGDESPHDVQATLLELTAATVARALRDTQPGTRRVIACGGGVRNPVLMGRLATCLGDVSLDTSGAYGLDPDFVEAMAFAWLARQTLAGLPGNLPSVTGAAGPRVLGAIHPA